MPASVAGIKSQVIPQAEESGAIDRFGVDVITRVEEVPTDRFPALMRSKGSGHPRFGNMAVSKVNWQAGKHGKFYRVTYTYEGFLLSLPSPTYQLTSSLSEEPIELHPDFDTIAGTPSTPANGAVFIDPETGKLTKLDAKGVFREFKAVMSGTQNPKAGIQSYLCPGAEWTEISFSLSRPGDLGSLGEIDSPSGSNPTFGSRTWLYSGVTYTQRGGIFEIRKSWLLSGRNGWDTDIY